LTSTPSADPEVSYVVITFNRPVDLAVCLRSLQEQTFREKEIIVVDNASTDDTRAMLARDFPDVRVVALPENRGVSGGRNAGTVSARGEICIYIDDDAWLVDPEATSTIVGYFRDDSRLACLALTIVSSHTGEEEMKSIPRRDKARLLHDYPTTYFCGCGHAFRRRAFLEAGMYWDPLVYGSQEIDLGYRLLERGDLLLHTSRVSVIHKSTPTARPSGQWVYFNTRDRPWVAARHLPWLAVASTTLLWWGHAGWVAFRTNQLGRFFLGIRDSLLGLGKAIRGRKRLSANTIRQLHKLSGRLWY
jgi:GT2 family glycosyltransferase